MRKIEKLIYKNERGETIEFSHASVFHTNDVKGLSDIRNILYSFNSMEQDGATYLGNRIDSREIAINGSFKATKKDDVVELRRHLNRVLNPHLKGILLYEYGGFKRIIDAVPETAPAFSRKSIFQDFTVSFICHNPYWREETQSKADIAAWIGGLEFDCEIDDTTGIEIGYREPSLIVNVYNAGDVSTGLRIDFKATGTVVNPKILNINTQEFIKINKTLQSGDILTVSTGYGEKAVELIQGAQTLDAFKYLDVDSTYIQLDIGDNLFRYEADSNADALEVSIYHDNNYLGV